ncbi:hypothetical protein P8H26_18040, partial [Pseudochrobactrum sp. sp1633]|uniref:hypothetical protein n=1 Tax=Pseudochrobactrum sp. sp1633 TaxID=3036706 RepID=UPI0025A62D92
MTTARYNTYKICLFGFPLYKGCNREKLNPKNERIKRDYFLYLEEAKRLQSSSYNVVQVGSKIAISSSPESAIINHDNLILRYEYQTYLKQVEGFAIGTIISILR